MSKRLIITFLTGLVMLSAYGQFGPGGVGTTTTNRFWQDATEINQTNGTNVASWVNLGGNTLTPVQATNANQPIVSHNTFNSIYSSVVFDGTNDWLRYNPTTDFNQGINDQRSFFLVFRTDTTITSRTIIYEEGGPIRGFNFYIYDSTLFCGAWNLPNDGAGAPWGFYYVNTGSVITPYTDYIISFTYQGNTSITGNVKFYVNGAHIGTITNVGRIFNHNQAVLGAKNQDSYFETGASYGVGEYFDGHIAEFIHFNYPVNDAERIIIQNYLSAKYDIGLDTNDYYKQDEVVNDNYDHEVAGIGKTTGSSDHDDAQGTGIVRMSSPSNLGNNEFLIWGRDTGALAPMCADVPDSIESRLQRDWSVSELGDVGTVTVKIDLSGVAGNLVANDLRLLIDDDGVYSSGATLHGPPTALGGGVFQWTGIDFADSNHFTVGTGGFFQNDLGPDTLLCPNDTLVLDATTSGGSYLWQNSSTDSIFAASEAGTYWVQVSWNNCVSYDTIVIDFLPELDLGNDTTICDGDSLLLDATTTNATYEWQDATTDSAYMANASGQYWVETSQPNCMQRDTIEIFITDNVWLGDDTILCPGDTLILDATAPNASYVWQDSTTDSSLTVTEDGTYLVGVTEHLCYSSDTIEVFFVKQIELGNDSILCPNASYDLDAYSPNGIYQWHNGDTVPTFHVNQPGTYAVTVVDGRCTMKDTIDIDYVVPLYLGEDTTMCPDASFVLDATRPPGTYLWQDGATTPTYQVTEEGTYWAEVWVHNCLIRDEVVVEYIKPIDLGNDTTLCPDTRLTLDATREGGTYLWQGTFKNPIYNVIRPGTYWVAVFFEHCILRDTINVDYYDTLGLEDQVTLCRGGTLEFNVSTPGATYWWSNGTQGSTLVVDDPGKYWAEVSVGPCVISDTVVVVPLPFPTLGNDTTICTNEQLRLDPKVDSATYLWHDGSTKSFYHARQEGTYWVEVTKDGCAPDTASVDIELVKCGCTVYIPNSFTPNFDGMNDELKVESDCDFEKFEFMVFDRWDRLVYETKDPTAIWDGMYDDEDLPDGVFAYRLYYMADGERQTRFGKLTIFR